MAEFLESLEIVLDDGHVIEVWVVEFDPTEEAT